MENSRKHYVAIALMGVFVVAPLVYGMNYTMDFFVGGGEDCCEVDGEDEKEREVKELAACAQEEGLRVDHIVHGMHDLKLNKQDEALDAANQVLFAGIDARDLDVVKDALEEGVADPNALNDKGMCPLSIAVFNGFDEIIDVLLAHKVDVNATPFIGDTFLMLGIMGGHEKVVSKLLQVKAYVDTPSVYTQLSPLVTALTKNDTAIVQLLLNHGAKVNEIVSYHYDARVLDGTPLSFVTEMGNVEMLKQLLNAKASVDMANKHGKTPLMVACGYEDEAVVRILIEAKANLNAEDKRKRTALVFAVDCESDGAVAKLLLDAGARLDTVDWQGKTPFDRACVMGNRKIQEIFFDKMMHSKAYTLTKNMGNTALIHGILTNKVELVKYALQANADVNVRTPQGETALSLAIDYGRELVVHTLLNHGADARAAIKNGVNYLMRAYDQPNIQIQQMIFDATQLPDGGALARREHDEYEEKHAEAVCCAIYPRCVHNEGTRAHSNVIQVCSACTFVNAATAKNCEMCDSRIA